MELNVRPIYTDDLFDLVCVSGVVSLIKDEPVIEFLSQLGYSSMFRHLTLIDGEDSKVLHRLLVPAILEGYFKVGNEISVYCLVSKDKNSNSSICAVISDGETRLGLDPFYDSMRAGLEGFVELHAKSKKLFRNVSIFLLAVSIISIGAAFIPALIAFFVMLAIYRRSSKTLAFARAAVGRIPPKSSFQQLIITDGLRRIESLTLS